MVDGVFGDGLCGTCPERTGEVTRCHRRFSSIRRYDPVFAYLNATVIDNAITFIVDLLGERNDISIFPPCAVVKGTVDTDGEKEKLHTWRRRGLYCQ